VVVVVAVAVAVAVVVVVVLHWQPVERPCNLKGSKV